MTAEIEISLARRILSELRTIPRFPCVECGRPSNDAPLRILSRQVVTTLTREPAGPLVFTGCWRCNEGDRLIRLAEAAIMRGRAAHPTD